jgi:hypothetical protein
MAKLSQRLFSAALVGALVCLQGLSVQACDKHPRGHQNSSETETDYSQKRGRRPWCRPSPL